MSKTSAKAKNAWAARNYDRISVTLPKGRKEEIKKLIAPQSINSFINQAINEKLDASEAPTTHFPTDP